MQERVTGNLGNAIFIAAYLIMPFFITLERVVERFRRLLGPAGGTHADAFAGGTYLFILGVQAVAIYFSQSRGPWLGLLTGAYVFVLVSLVALRRAAADRSLLSGGEVVRALSLALFSPLVGVIPAYLGLLIARRGRRWLWLSWCLQALLVAGFLVAFNLPHSPLAPLRSVPGLGRLGQVFETESGTGKVRVLIWEGAVEMLKANPARTLVGYGPESMYVAYNPFYPAELAHYESRTASPDRSHNETFDALVTTGAIGFLVYFSLFVAIFYYGLRWLGFLPEGKAEGGSWQRPAFFGLTIGGSILGIAVPYLLDHSLRFAGVGVAAGMIAGVALYLAASAVAGREDAGVPAGLGEREFLLAALLAMIVGHFVEIHFGIAIAATRLYYWLGLALLLVVGGWRLADEPAEALPAIRPAVALNSRKRGRRRREARLPSPVAGPHGAPLTGAIVAGLLGALFVGTLFFDFTTNTGGLQSTLQTVWSTLAAIGKPGEAVVPSPGIGSMVGLTLILGAVLLIGEAENAGRPVGRRWWRCALAWYAGIAVLLGTFYGFVHAAQLQVERDLSQVISLYYAFVLGIILLAGVFLPAGRAAGASFWRGGWGWVAYPVVLVAALVAIVGNANVVRADIYYKQAWDGYHRPGSESLAARRIDAPTAERYYELALGLYDRAVRLAPHEDYYLLFRGKAYLELSSFTGDPQMRLAGLARAEEDLKRARELNPLNTDHTANLARLYRNWAAAAGDEAERQEKLRQSVEQYRAATRLSPHNAMLYNEWAQALIALGEIEEGLNKFEESLAIDDRFAQTYLLLGDYYAGLQDTGRAIDYYEKAVEVDPESVQAHSVLGQLYAEAGRYTEAISENLAVLALYPQDYVSQKNLAVLYYHAGRPEEALAAAVAARQLAPESDAAALDQFITQMQEAIGQGGRP